MRTFWILLLPLIAVLQPCISEPVTSVVPKYCYYCYGDDECASDKITNSNPCPHEYDRCIAILVEDLGHKCVYRGCLDYRRQPDDRSFRKLLKDMGAKDHIAILDAEVCPDSNCNNQNMTFLESKMVIYPSEPTTPMKFPKRQVKVVSDHSNQVRTRPDLRLFSIVLPGILLLMMGCLS